MIPPLEDFFSACEFLARRFQWELSPRDEVLLEALTECHAEAQRLAKHVEHEPAAIFYAFSRDLYRLGDDYVAVPTMMALNHAMTLGRRPSLDFHLLCRDLVRWAREISARLVAFEAFRAWFDERVIVLHH